MKVYEVKKARKDVKGTDIKKGDKYYWWVFRFGGKRCSKTYPKASQLTQNDILSEVYQIQERIESLTIEDDFENEVESMKNELEDLQNQCEDRLANIPDQLQSAPVGQRLQNRCEAIQEMCDNLDSIDFEIDEDDIKSNLKKKDDETEKEYKQRILDEIKNKKEEILSEIQSISYNGE